jgi:DNA primase
MADQVINDIKDRLNLTEVISSYIEVKKSGGNFKAVCPFHGERTASLMISPQKQIWHCFGCGEGGDVFGFVMRYENLNFRETLELLAERAGVTLPVYQGSKSPADNTDDLLRINSFAAELYHRYLNSQSGAETARKYLQERGLTEPTIELWRIGFAPNSYDFLQKALTAKKISFDRMVAAGVASRSDRGQNFDRFRNRVTFPIFNYRGDTVGFSARILPGDGGNSAKYVNSPETAIYNKSKILFGLNFAKEAIRKAGEVVIVEGQVDVIQAHQAGFTNTVATSGTALTEDHLRLLARLTKQLKFCFDADSAGLAATQRAGKLALQMGFGVKIIVLDKDKDPDDLIRSSPSLWQKASKEAVWFVDYYLNQGAEKFPGGSLEQKQYLNEMVIPLLSYISNSVEQDHYIKQLSQKFGISERVVRDAAKKPKDPAAPAPIAAAAVSGVLPQNIAEKQILGGLLAFPEFLDWARTQGLATEAFSPDLQPLVTLALAGSLTAENATDTLAKEAIFMVESGLDEVADDRNVYLRDLQTSANLLKLTHLKRQLQDLTVHISKAQTASNTERLSELNRRFAALTQERIQLENQL